MPCQSNRHGRIDNSNTAEIKKVQAAGTVLPPVLKKIPDLRQRRQRGIPPAGRPAAPHADRPGAGSLFIGDGLPNGSAGARIDLPRD
jgi:hypothetical protein